MDKQSVKGSMKKSEYWQLVRTELGHKGHERYSRPEGKIVVNTAGLASYAHDYWKHNGVLPDDYLPIPERGEEGTKTSLLRQMWGIVLEDISFQDVVLDAFEKHYFTPGKEECVWGDIVGSGFGPFGSYIVAPQLRRMYQKALLLSSGIDTGDKDLPCVGLMHLCVEHCRLKFNAITNSGCDQARFENADVLSLIKDDNSPVKIVETVLETFETVRHELRTRIGVSYKEDMECFNKDIRPILLGKLMNEAKTFASWQKVFGFSSDRDTKIYALYQMSDKAKSLGQVVAQYQNACSIGFESVANSFEKKWKEMCTAMSVEDLMNMPTELGIDRMFVRTLILQKCED